MNTYMTIKFVDADSSLITTVGDAIELLQEQIRNLENGNGCDEMSMKPIQLTEEKFREIEGFQKQLIEQEQNELYITAYRSTAIRWLGISKP